MGVGFDFKRLRLEAGLGVREITELIGAGEARWRKMEEKNLNPKTDKGKIESFFGGKPIHEIAKMTSIREFLKVQNNSKVDEPTPPYETAQAYAQTPFLKEYIDEMKEKTSILQEQNKFLQRITETRLLEISNTQLFVLAQVKTGLQWEAHKSSGGDEKKKESISKTLDQFNESNLKDLTQDRGL